MRAQVPVGVWMLLAVAGVVVFHYVAELSWPASAVADIVGAGALALGLRRRRARDSSLSDE
jgi:hypothetical protein